MKKGIIVDNSLIIVALALVLTSFLIKTSSSINDRLQHLITNESNDFALNGSIDVQDSLDLRELCEQAQLSNLGTTNFIGPVGISKLELPALCVQPQPIDKNNINSYYLVLAGYRMSATSSFSIRGDKYVLKFLKEDPNGNSHGSYETKEIPVRYVRPDQGLQSSQSGYVLVPIGRQAYKTLHVLAIMLRVALSLLLLYYVILRPLKTTINISKGRVFSYQNTNNLRVAGRLFMAIAIIPVFVQLIFYYVFARQIPMEIWPAFPQILIDNKLYFIIAFIMLVLAKAFEKGYRLQKENSSII